MTWTVRLRGDREILRLLVVHYVGEELCLTEGSDGVYLGAACFGGLAAKEEVARAAKPLIEVLNGLMWLAMGYHCDLSYDLIVREDDLGQKMVYMSFSDTVTCTDFLVISTRDGEPDSEEVLWTPISTLNSTLPKVLNDPRASAALRFLKGGKTGWVELYKVFELIREDLAPLKLEDSGWITKRQLSAFTASANHPKVSGEDARHAVQSGQVPKNTMDLGTAQNLMSMLLRQWLDSKA